MPSLAETDKEQQRAKELINATKSGKMPTTQQAVDGLAKIQQSDALHDASRNMSADGKKVVADVERLLDDSRKTLQQTNSNNELQKTIYHSNRAAQMSNSQANLHFSSEADRLIKAGSKAAELVKIIITSSEFRSAVQELTDIAQEVLQGNVEDASSDLANDPNAPEKLRSAAQNVHGQVKKEGVQNASQQGIEAGKQAGQDNARYAQDKAGEYQNRGINAGQTVKDRAGNSLVEGKSIRDTSHVIIDSLADQIETHLPSDKVDQVSEAIRSKAADFHTGQDSAGAAKDRTVSSLMDQKDSLKQQLQDENSNLRQSAARIGGQLTKLPAEKRRVIVAKIKNVVQVLQSKSEYQQGIEDMIALLAPLANQLKDATSSTVDSVADAPLDPREANASRDARLAVTNAKQLIENFASGKSLNSLIKSIQKFAVKSRDDTQLQAFWDELSRFISRSVREVGFVNQDGFERQANDLIDRARDLLDKYQYYTSNISYEARAYASALASNKLSSRLQSDTAALVNDLFLDERGKATFKPELLRDLTSVIPKIAERLAYLPIPRIEVDDGTYHVIFDNIILHSTILPKYVRIQAESTIDATKQGNDTLNTFFNLEISKITASARDISWMINKHSGFIKAGDTGLADFDIEKDGLTVKMKIIPGSETSIAAPSKDVEGRFLHGENVRTTLSNLSLRLHDSNHDFLYKIAKPILQKFAKKQIEEQVSQVILELIGKVDDQLALATQKVTGVPQEGPKIVNEKAEWTDKAFNPR